MNFCIIDDCEYVKEKDGATTIYSISAIEKKFSFRENAGQSTPTLENLDGSRSETKKSGKDIINMYLRDFRLKEEI